MKRFKNANEPEQFIPCESKTGVPVPVKYIACAYLTFDSSHGDGEKLCRLIEDESDILLELKSFYGSIIECSLGGVDLRESMFEFKGRTPINANGFILVKNPRLDSDHDTVWTVIFVHATSS